jgi:heme exporter protein C
MLVAIYAVFVYVPTERVMGIVQRIFYFHVPSAWVAFLAFFVTFVASIGYLGKRSRRWDVLAASSAELGVVFAMLVLLTGPLWARPVWNTWWTWDPRLTTTLILWLIYAGYFMLRTAIDDPQRRARYSAVLGIVGFIDVPIVFMAIRWWRTIHPVLLTSEGFELEPPMVATLLISLLAFTLLYAYLFVLRVRVEETKDRLESLRSDFETWECGDMETPG